jgi:hypothetical protein
MKKIILLCLLVIGLLLVGCGTGEMDEPTNSDEEILPEIEEDTALAGQAGGDTFYEYAYHTCIDTDGGENANVGGIVSITYDATKKDKATGAVIKEYKNRKFDYADRFSKGKLYERKCKDGFVSGQSKSPLGFKKFLASDCPNGFDTTSVTSELTGRVWDRPQYGYVGYCVSANGPECTTDADCPESTIEEPYCDTQGYACDDSITYICENPGTLESSCQPEQKTCMGCDDGKVCENGACNEECIISDYSSCNGIFYTKNITSNCPEENVYNPPLDCPNSFAGSGLDVTCYIPPVNAVDDWKTNCQICGKKICVNPNGKKMVSFAECSDLELQGDWVDTGEVITGDGCPSSSSGGSGGSGSYNSTGNTTG